MRIKIFNAEDEEIYELEDRINTWLLENQNIHIVDRKQSESMCAYKAGLGYLQVWSMTISIMYQPLGKGIKPKKGHEI